MNTEAMSDILNQVQGNKKIFTDALFSRPTSLASLLPYDEYYQEEQMFIMKDGSLGVVFAVTLLEHESMTEHEVVNAIKSVKPWFSLPENCVLQVVFEQSEISSLDPSLNPTLNPTLDSRNHATVNSHPVSEKLFQRRIDDLKHQCNQDHQAGPKPLRRTGYISIRYFPKQKLKGQLRDIFSEGNTLLKGELHKFLSELRSFKGIVNDFRSNSVIKLRQISASELTDHLRKFFNPETYYRRTFAPFNPNLFLSDQFIYTSPVLDHTSIEREGIKTRTLSLKTSPQYAYPGGMAYFTKLEFPYKMSLSFSFPTRQQVKRFFDVKEFFLQNSVSARAKVQQEEISDVQNRLARDDRCLNMTFTVVIEGKTEGELDDKTRAICNVFNNKLECEVIVEDKIGLGMCLNALPLSYSPDSDESSQRSIRILRSDAQNFMPIFDSFRGMPDPQNLYLSREHNLVPFSLLANETSNHTVVLADSGSGKSALVIDLIQGAKRLDPEPLVFILDKKSSYSMLCEYYDGDLTVFDRNGEIPFSPFRGHYDEEKVAFLTRLIASAIQLTSPSFNLESEHQGAISKGIKLAYSKKVERQGLRYVAGKLIHTQEEQEVSLTMEDVVGELAGLPDSKEVVGPLLQKLRPFYGDGIYAKFFGNIEKTSQKSNLFYVYDLDALDGDPVLQTLMTMAVIEEIRQIISLPENVGRPGFIVMEEFAMLGRNNPMFRDFAIDFAETMRKRGVWLITLTPRPQNYFDLEVGQAFWSVADNFIFLQMSSDNVDYLSKNSSLLDEANCEIIRSLQTKRGKYAEVFFMNKKKNTQGAFRYHQTSMMRWMSPTNAKEMAAAQDALMRFDDKWEALNYLEKTYPEGI